MSKIFIAVWMPPGPSYARTVNLCAGHNEHNVLSYGIQIAREAKFQCPVRWVSVKEIEYMGDLK